MWPIAGHDDDGLQLELSSHIQPETRPEKGVSFASTPFAVLIIYSRFSIRKGTNRDKALLILDSFQAGKSGVKRQSESRAQCFSHFQRQTHVPVSYRSLFVLILSALCEGFGRGSLAGGRRSVGIRKRELETSSRVGFLRQ